VQVEAMLVSAGVMGFAAALQGFLGFGFGILAMSGLALTQDVVHASGVVNLAGLLTTSAGVVRLRHAVMWPVVVRILPALMLGVLFGVTALRSLDGELLLRLLGVTIAAIAAWNLWTPRFAGRDSRAVDLGVGLLSGALGGAFNTGGPPLIAHLYRRPDSPDALRATLQTLFVAIGSTRLVTAASQGLFTREVLIDAAAAVPAVGAGLLLGLALGRRVSAARFRRASWAALGALGVVLVASH
jgi:uncharacterized membrane protein YfcA